MFSFIFNKLINLQKLEFIKVESDPYTMSQLIDSLIFLKSLSFLKLCFINISDDLNENL
jgi:hypothetical protein